jgi:hypothetical protein
VPIVYASAIAPVSTDRKSGHPHCWRRGIHCLFPDPASRVPKEDCEHYATDGKGDGQDDRKLDRIPQCAFSHVVALSAESLCPGVDLVVVTSRLAASVP